MRSLVIIVLCIFLSGCQKETVTLIGSTIFGVRSDTLLVSDIVDQIWHDLEYGRRTFSTAYIGLTKYEIQNRLGSPNSESTGYMRYELSHNDRHIVLKFTFDLFNRCTSVDYHKSSRSYDKSYGPRHDHRNNYGNYGGGHGGGYSGYPSHGGYPSNQAPIIIHNTASNQSTPAIVASTTSGHNNNLR